MTQRGPLSVRRERAVLDRAQARMAEAVRAGDHLPLLRAIAKELQQDYFTRGSWTRGWSAARIADEAVELLAKKIAAEKSKPYVRWSRRRAGRRGVWDLLLVDVRARMAKGASQSKAIDAALAVWCGRRGMSKQETERYIRDKRQAVKQAHLYRRGGAQAR